MGPSDVRPIAVGEVLRRITSKCICHLIRVKAADTSFNLCNWEPACRLLKKWSTTSSVAPRTIVLIRTFVVLKVDMTNAFNLVSRQAVLDNCAQHFPELLAWTSWCYSQHPLLWHQLGILTSQVGVQQGDPLGPFLFTLVLQRIVTKIYTALMMFTLFEVYVKPKCWPCELTIFKALSTEADLPATDPHCQGHLILNAMQHYDADILRSFANCAGLDTSDTAWKQAKMSLRRGGLGLRSLADHSSAAYIASFCTDCNTLSVSSLKDNSPNQKKLSDSIEELQFNSLLGTSSTADSHGGQVE
ncbi:hypothetical protein EMCRGX_G022454 [Ephydatia muelleri]